MNQNLSTKQLTEKVFDLLSKHKDKQKFIEDCSETFSGNELIQFADLLEKLEKNKNLFWNNQLQFNLLHEFFQSQRNPISLEDVF